VAIRKDNQSLPPDPSGLALGALAWVLADERRARRFLDLTGLTPERLRARIESPELQASVLDFLAAHEPDLVAAAEALGLEPAALVSAREGLGR
jgi:hypothetical protein